MISWDSWNTWKFVSPPSRPSRAQIRAADRVIQCCSKDRPVCVLGSTVEYRSLLARRGFRNVYVIDKSDSFKAWSDQFLPADLVRDEKYIQKDWGSALGEFLGAFSLIFSDLTIGNIPFDRQVSTLEAVARSLDSDGLFLDKLLHLSGRRHSIDNLVERFSDSPISIDSANEFGCRAVFTSALIEECGIVDTALIYSELRRRISDTNTMSILALSVEYVTPEGCVWYYGRQAKSLFAAYQKLFSMQRVYAEPRTSPYFGNCDFFCSVRRNNANA
jgi:hypothetical protein